MSKITGLVISDLHLGSAFGIFPQEFIGSTGSEINLNMGQEYLLRAFDWVLEQIPQRLDFLIINGDVADGTSEKEEGRWRVEPDPEFQVLAAKKLFLRGDPPLLHRPRKTYVSRGSAYHSGTGAYLDEIFAREIGAERDRMGHFSSSWRILSCGGIDIDFSHHRSTHIRYEATPGERELQFDRMVADLKGGSSDLILRSHGHRYVRLNVDGDLYVSTPAFQLQTNFAKMSRWPNRYLSRTIGAVRLDLYPEKKKDGIQNKEDYVKVTALLRPHSKIGKEEL